MPGRKAPEVVDDTARLRTLLLERARDEWLHGEPVRAVAPVGHVTQGRYRVRGLDHDGLPRSTADRVLDSMTDANHAGIYTVVRGDHPECSAVALYQAARHEHTWLTITSHRVAVLRLRDVQNRGEAVADQVVAEVQQHRSVGGVLRGIGRIVGSSAVELARSVRRPPLADRPQDAVLERTVELSVVHLRSIVPWKPPLLPSFRGGPRYVQVHLADGSWACFETDLAGAAVLTGTGAH